MKKFFFPKTSSSHGGEQHQKCPATRDKKQSSQMRRKTLGSGHVENKVQSSEHFFPVCERKIMEKNTISRTRSLVLRRSLSFQMSSAANSGRFSEQDLTGLRNWNNIPSSNSRCDRSDCDNQFSNGGHPRPEGFNVATIQIPHEEVLRDHGCSCPSNSGSPRSSIDTTSVPGKVLDLYIDGEHHQEMKLGISDQYPRSSKESNLFLFSDGASRDYPLKSENRHESPRKLAKDVFERLLRIEQLSGTQKHGNNCPRWEKDDMQSRLQKELDRRSDEWEIKLREFQSEEHRLRDRVRELAEQNVSLQREISDFYRKEEEYTDRLSHMEVHLKNLISEMDVTRSENDSLERKLSEIQDKLKVAEEVQSSMERNCKEKEKEYMELIKVVARLRGTCNEQERTIDGLRQCLNSESTTNKLQMEQLRLTGVEQDLRRQLETCTAETNSLRSENIYLLERLKNMGKVGGSSALKLEHELVSRVQCLQNMGLSLLNECIQMCENLLGVLESKTTSEGFMESHSLIQYGSKVQGFRKGLEQLTRSLGKTASVLMEKADITNSASDLPDTPNRNVLEDDLRSELKAERLLTSILKEKLYSKEKDTEQMQVELARALRSHDVLKREIQDASDTVLCVNHKMKNLELQIINKDGTINQLQGDIQSYEEELTTTRGILSKVSHERDLMWQEVKDYSEKNMLLNREVESHKKKIETLEEDTLLKDGQISILKDSLNNAKSFNILFGTEQVTQL